MRTKPALLLAVFLLGFNPRSLSAQEPSSPSDSRYRLVQVVEASVLQDKINEAGREGYRLAGVAPASGGTTVAVLEKAGGSEETYSYLSLDGKGDAALQQSLNDAGSKGFRLLSRDVVLDWRIPGPLQLRKAIAWMEKPPGAAKKFEYAVIPFGIKSAGKAAFNPKYWADTNPLDYVKPDIARQEAQGFHLIRIVSGVALIMERGDASASGAPPAFRSLTSLRGSKLQRKLQEQAAGGYCVADIDPEAPVVWPSILLDKSKTDSANGVSEPCSYEVIEKRNLGEDDFNQIGARGFRLVPQSLNYYGAYQTSTERRERGEPEINAVFEKSGSTNEEYHYRSFSASQLADLSEKLEQAGAEGYHAIKVDSVRDGAVMVIMKKSETLASK